MNRFEVNVSRCARCGLCAKDCPSYIIELDGQGRPFIPAEKRALCMECQHCLAICPTGAISVLGKKPEDSRPISACEIPGFEQMDHFVRSRRSIRHYRDENVEPALIDRLLKSLAHSPTGCNAQELTFHVIDDRAVMRRFSDRLVEALCRAAKGNASSNPFFEQIEPLSPEAVSWIVFRGAPHALIVSAPQDAPCPREDIALSLAYFELLAQSAGLGTVWWGFLRVALGFAPEAAPVLGIPENHDYGAILFGKPSIKFARTVQKEDAAKVRRIAF